MKNLACLLAVAALFVAIGITMAALYAGYKWKHGAVYCLVNDAAMISAAERRALGKEFRCLSCVSGKVYHGKDTYELMKFDVNIRNESWNELTNAVYAIYERVLSSEAPSDGAKNSIHAVHGDLANSDEIMHAEWHHDDVRLYFTCVKNSERRFLYLKGPLIPVSMLGQVVRHEAGSD